MAAAVGNDDHVLHAPAPAPGNYTVAVTGTGGGRLAAYTSLPELPLGEWVVGAILRPGGKDWYQLTLAAGQSALHFAAGMLGLYSHLEATPGNLTGRSVWSAAGPTMSLTVPSSAPGTYYVELYDSARVSGEARG